ncbi:RNA-directed DNA polymerase, eukaryota [Tanacetum coccineum]
MNWLRCLLRMKNGNDEGFNAAEKSYVHVVKGNPHSGSMGSDPKPAIALDDDCLLTKDLCNSLLGRVKEFAFLSNLRTALINEGWVSIFWEESNDDESDVESKGGDPKTHDLGSCGEDGDVVEVPETLFEEERHSNDIPVEENTNPKENHSEDLFGIYSLLNKKKATIGEDGPSDQSPIYPPGFTPAATTNEPCTNAENADNVNCSHQEGFKLVVADHNAVESVSNSGGILCVWDPYLFRKTSSTVSDYFVIIRGVWLKTGNNLLIVSVYAPHDMKEKHMLWDYLTHVIHSWNGEVVIMGDFNEVRYKSDRFGSVFNVHGANAFNSFIANAGLEEVPLGGSSFTWCHKSATKMTRQRYLSDHRPILLRESRFNYGSSPFRFYNHWSEVVNSLQEIDKLQTMEIAQKAKIKWCIEGDENSNFFHGMLNKRRSQLSIHGIMVDGVWIEDPD